MAARKSRTKPVRQGDEQASRSDPPDSGTGEMVSVSAQLMDKVERIARSGITPAHALDLMGCLLAEVPAAAGDRMEMIKMMDTLIKTSRSMMETRLKFEDAAAIMSRLDEIEARMDAMASGGD